MNELALSSTRSGPVLPPGPRGLPGLGTPQLSLDPLRAFERLHGRHGPAVHVRLGSHHVIAGAEPAFARRILIDNPGNYTKSRFTEGLGLVMGQGLVTSNGEHWRRQRRLAQPAFRRSRVRALVPSIVACVDECLTAWERRSDPEVDVHAQMSALTLRIVFRTLFGQEPGVDVPSLGPDVRCCLGRAQDYAASLVRLPLWLPTPSNIAFGRAKRRLDQTIKGLIERRRTEPPREDLLGMLMDANDGDDGAMDSQQLRDEVMTMFIAGHETMTNAMSWVWMLLEQHPRVARRVGAEIDAVLGQRPIQADDLDALVYTEQVIQEALRLYPPIWMLGRRAREDDVVGPWRIPAGTIVVISPWVMHRRAELWVHAERFDPERFAPARRDEVPKYAYLPFGAGPRVCIGAQLAMMETKIILAGLARRFRIEVHEPRRIAIRSRVTLGPRGGMRGRLHRRRRGDACPPARGPSRASTEVATCPFAEEVDA